MLIGEAKMLIETFVFTSGGPNLTSCGFLEPYSLYLVGLLLKAH